MADGSLSALAAREKFSDLLNRAAYAKERVIIRRHGKPIAALVPVEDLKRLWKLDDEDDAKAARAAVKAWIKDGRRSVPWVDLKKKLGL